MVARWLRQASAPESQHHHGFLLRLVPLRPYGSGTCGEGAIQQLAPLRWPVLSCAGASCLSVQSAAQACNELFIVELLPQLLGRLLFDAKTRWRQRCGVISTAALHRGASADQASRRACSEVRACCSSCIGHRTQGALLPCHGLCCTLLPRRAQHGL